MAARTALNSLSNEILAGSFERKTWWSCRQEGALHVLYHIPRLCWRRFQGRSCCDSKREGYQAIVSSWVAGFQHFGKFCRCEQSEQHSSGCAAQKIGKFRFSFLKIHFLIKTFVVCFRTKWSVAAKQNFKWDWNHEQAEEDGLADAQFNLACYYAQGAGVPVSHAEALHWYKKAATQGHVKAQVRG